MRSANEDEVCRLTTSLEAETCAGELDEGGSAPAVAGSAGYYALAILAADDEGSLFEARDDGDAGSFGGNVVGNALVGSGHEFVQDCVSGFDTLIKLCHVGGCRCGDGDGHSQRRSGANGSDKLANHQCSP